ncbi:MAG: hypothetical protein PHQ58_01155 [Rhodoferax sp.]|uniref:hypothetical protein n=1 Tax=Rhodoferax sp. TaxID=50421 RepID=UPI0026382D4A|nr:hypothetical protein [Rhodoferax sp.]MDD2879019.1 hypothetical protein [Rhodoferax sp.]
MKIFLKNWAYGVASAGLLSLYGCGGSDGGTVADAPVTPVPAVPVAGELTLSSLSFTDAANFYTRLLTSSPAQNTPDASGNIKQVERRQRSAAGNLAKWGTGGDPWRQSDVHWNGSAWANCPINFENTAGVPDALGNNAYNYCGNFETGNSARTTSDIGGKTMAEVYAQVRSAGHTNLSVADPAVLGSTVFPVGSSLYGYTFTTVTAAISYYPGGSFPVGESNLVTQYSLAVSSGGVVATQPAGTGCNSPEFDGNGANSTTLEGMMGAMTGTPCEYTGGSFVYGGVTYTNPDAPRNEAWGQSSVDIGKVGSAPVGTGTAPGFFTTNTKLRVAFKGPGTNPVTYYACKERFNNGSTRNCTPIGTGTYTIATLADARVLTLNNLPTQAAPLSFTRVFVERNGVIYQGYQNKLGVSTAARLNTVATTALLAKLGVSAENPSAPLTLTAGSYQGTWDLRDPRYTDGTTVFFKADGSFTCQSSAGLANTCTFAITDPATGAFTYSEPGNSAASGTLSALLGTGSGTYKNTDGSTGSFVAQRR